MSANNKNWCPFFEDCKSSKSEEECSELATEDEINIFIDALKEEIKSGKQSDAAKKVLKEVFNIEVKPVIRTFQDLIDNNYLY